MGINLPRNAKISTPAFIDCYNSHDKKVLLNTNCIKTIDTELGIVKDTDGEEYQSHFKHRGHQYSKSPNFIIYG